MSGYWLVDPAVPSITVLRLVGSAYEDASRATGDEVLVVTDPVAVELVPARLV